MTEIELELTYLAKAMPEGILSVTPKRLVDIYIPETEGVHPRLRLRQKGDVYQLTKKTQVADGDASIHNEVTITLDEKEFDALEKVSQKRVVKDRYQIDIDGYPAEVDVFKEDLEGLVVIDFEFNDNVSKNSFTPPNVCLADVTQENFIAGGLLAGKSYGDIVNELSRFNYKRIK